MAAQLSREQLLSDIEHAEEKAATLCGACSEDHARLAGYMRMLLAVMSSEPVAEVVSKFGDPEAFGERELKVLIDIQKMPYGARFYTVSPAPEQEG